jgi:hypothetical protein
MSDRANHLRERWQRTLTVLRAPRIRIEVSGGHDARVTYLSYTSRHPRFRMTAFKRWGVALLPLPDSFDQYLSDCSRQARRRRLHATKAGFRYAVVSPQDHLDEILEINRSTPIRQGHPMAGHYVDRARVAKTFEGRSSIHGIVDSGGRLRAYALVHDIGDAFTFSLLIGHADDLDEGVMYLLVTEVIRTCIDARRAAGSPAWLMFDTFWGATKGLAFFKERVGFRPYTVDWVWVEG